MILHIILKIFFDEIKTKTGKSDKIFPRKFFTIDIAKQREQKMKIYTSFSDDILYLCLQGEMDEHNAVHARREADALAERYAGCSRAVFDLRSVSFMDSTGIGFLIGRYKTFKRYGVPSFVTGASYETDKILSMSGVYTLMPKV